MERREKIEQIVREREKMRLELSQRKWSRREEVDFFRTISSFGVEYNKHRKQYDWNKFRSLSRLEKKTDESMTEYYNAFYTMLKRSCGLKISEEEGIFFIETRMCIIFLLSTRRFCFYRVPRSDGGTVERGQGSKDFGNYRAA